MSSRDIPRQPDPTEGLDDLPRRIFLTGTQRLVYDPDGFVLPFSRGETLTAADLLDHQNVLVVAPPWTGKSFVAEQLDRALQYSRHQLCKLTSFEDFGRGASVEPSWWATWRRGTDRAYWILDALDEDERRRDRRIYEVLDLVEGAQQARSRLHLLFFCRVNEVPPRFQKRIDRLFGAWSPERPQGVRLVRLAGLDREAARELVGRAHFERVRQLIRDNQLAELASLPAVLEYLRENKEASLTRGEVWRGVLEGLLRRRPDREQEFEIEDAFEVAQRIAAVLTFSGQGGFNIEAPGLECTYS